MSLFTGHSLTCVRSERVVFLRLDFAAHAGDALVLLGPNGSGKSSLLRLMAGLLKPFAGSMSWQGEPVTDDMEGHRARLHYVGHHDAVKPVLTVAENLSFWAGLHGVDPDKAARDLASALSVFDLERLADVPGRFLSAGQRRRLNLARIIACPAPLWLLDEPTTALDRASIAKLEAAIEDHRKDGGVVVLSTHADIGLEGYRVLQLDHFAAPNDGDWMDMEAAS